MARRFSYKCYSLLGTPAYRAPEISIERDASKFTTGYDSKVDLWSAGVTFYAMTSGDLPFDDDDLERQACEGDYNFDGILSEDTHVDFRAIICGLLTVNQLCGFLPLKLSVIQFALRPMQTGILGHNTMRRFDLKHSLQQ